MKTFCAYFRMNGGLYSWQIEADDLVDAKRRHAAILANSWIDGELVGESEASVADRLVDAVSKLSDE